MRGLTPNFHFGLPLLRSVLFPHSHKPCTVIKIIKKDHIYLICYIPFNDVISHDNAGINVENAAS